MDTPEKKLVLVKHEQMTFEDQTVHLTGHAYIACKFRRCTLVNGGPPYHLEGCAFDACNWHVDCTVLWGDPAARLALRRFVDLIDPPAETTAAAA